MARRRAVADDTAPAAAGDAAAGAEAVQRWEVQLRKGALELAVLAALCSGELYGLEILRRLEEDAGLVVPEGTVYPLLNRLRAEGWVTAEWVEAEAGHPRKYYRLSPAGRRHATALARSWSSFADSLDRLGTDMGTLAVATEDPSERADPNVVKAIIAFDAALSRLGRALYFTRAAAPSGAGPVYHHIGIYAFRRAILERFATLPPSPLEQRERLEQLRALEAGITIGVALVDTNPLGVDTPEDLARARAEIESRAI